ncbi:MAG TPA: histidinol-phosphate transaminase [Methanobacteriaceae archaeon]|nr:histidinol-phosphate transaminase [Methanobacteriaceae archaeon]
MNVKKTVEELDPYVPGRSIYEIATKYGLNPKEIIKLGSNENPLGPSPKAIKAVQESAKNMHRYPESDLSELIHQISLYSQVKPEQVIVGGDGADEILDVLGKTFMEPGDEFIVPLPSYMYYEFTLTIQGAIPVYARWNVEKNQLDTESVLEAMTSRTKIIFLCTPNNPTGGLISKEDIKKILESTDALVVVDEAYFEFSGVENVDLLEDYDNIFILRTFSKVLGLAGMRIGYGLSSPEIIEYMHRVKPVFSLTKLSYVAALETLQDSEYIEKSRELSVDSRELLYHGLKNFSQLRVFKSYANYLLMDIRETGMDAAQVTEELMKRGVIVRNCSSFKGLDDYWIRVSVGTLEEDERFLEILKEITQ